MGKKAVTKHQKLKNGTGSSLPRSDDPIEALLNRARLALEENLDHIEAMQWALKALELDKDNVNVLEFLGAVCAEFGHEQQAVHYFEQCIALSPACGATKYLYLAQLSGGEASLKYYMLSVDCLLKELEKKEKMEDVLNSLGSAYVSMAELYMTDLCDLDNAEAECENCLLSAKKYASDSYEVNQCVASFRLSQERHEDALVALQESLLLWWPKKKALQLCNEIPADDDLSWVPPFDFRVQTVKLLLELSQYNDAEEILGDMLSTEDQEHPVLWYLLGFSAYLQNDFVASHDALKESHKFYRRRRKQNRLENTDEEGVDDGLREAILALVKDIESKPKELWDYEVDDGQQSLSE